MDMAWVGQTHMLSGVSGEAHLSLDDASECLGNLMISIQQATGGYRDFGIVCSAFLMYSAIFDYCINLAEKGGLCQAARSSHTHTLTLTHRTYARTHTQRIHTHRTHTHARVQT